MVLERKMSVMVPDGARNQTRDCAGEGQRQFTVTLLRYVVFSASLKDIFPSATNDQTRELSEIINMEALYVC
jgi:hypothetical protein